MGELRQTVQALRETQHDAPTSLRAPASINALWVMFDTLPIEVKASIDVPERLPAPVEGAVFGIAQEALTNVVKHSAAESTAAEVSVGNHQHRTYVHLTITDPGPHKQQHGPKPRGFGIRGMQERAASLGGDLTAEPYAGGFRVRADIPVGEAN